MVESGEDGRESCLALVEVGVLGNEAAENLVRRPRVIGHAGCNAVADALGCFERVGDVLGDLGDLAAVARQQERWIEVANREIHPADLLGRVYESVPERTGVDANEVDNVFTGCAMQVAEQSSGIARTAWLSKGLPERAGATTVDIRCGSGQQALNLDRWQISRREMDELSLQSHRRALEATPRA